MKRTKSCACTRTVCAAAPLDELEEEELEDDELLELDEELLERPELDELEEEEDDEDDDELDELTGGSSLPPPHAKRAVADISTPASFMVRITPDSDRVVNIGCYLIGIMTALNVETWSANNLRFPPCTSLSPSLNPDQTRTVIVHSFASMVSFADYTGDLLGGTATP